MRKKRLLLNTAVAILSQVMSLMFGLIVPKLIISSYGSEANGLVSSITQFLAFFSLMEMGVGGVIRAALYKPLAKKDLDQISKIMVASKKFFNKIGFSLCIYSIILMLFFPIIIEHQMSYVSTVILVASIALSYIAQYMFGITNQLLLIADQKSYVQMLISCLIIALNTCFCVLLIQLNSPIELVKLVSGLVLLLRPLLLKLYVSKYYKINYSIKLTSDPLEQKWSALTHNIAYYVTKYSDVVVLTFFSTLSNVSIYYVYTLVTHSLQQMIEMLTTGMGSLLGDMYARKEKDKLYATYNSFEWLIHTVVTIIYTIAAILIIPFVKVYTQDISDTNYIVPLFSFCIVFASAAYSIRLPYNTMVQSAGHFRQTKISAIVEAALNVIISVLLVWKLGLVGVAIGTVIAMVYRTCYLVWYLSKNILYRPIKFYFRQLLMDLAIAVIAVFLTMKVTINGNTYFQWLIMLLEVSIIVLLISIIMNIIFYNKQVRDAICMLFYRKK